MRKLIFGYNITLDGYIDHDATIADEELHDVFSELLRTADMMLYGRVAYNLLAEFWPTAAGDTSLPASMREFAKVINPLPKIVFSRTMEKAGWNTTIEREFDPGRIRALKMQPGKNILLGGGASMARTFMKHGLIDEYRFLVHPIMLGQGKRLFDDGRARQDLELVSTRVLGSGVVELVYHKVEPAGRR
jgi:dihydrofolate reductase